MTELEFNKTWSDRSLSSIAHFFENFYVFSGNNDSGRQIAYLRNDYLWDKGYNWDIFRSLVGNPYWNDYGQSGTFPTGWTDSTKTVLNNGQGWQRALGSSNFNCFITSSEGVDELDKLNSYAYHTTTGKSKTDTTDTIYDAVSIEYYMMMDALITDPMAGEVFQEFIRRNVPGKEKLVWQKVDLDFNNVELTNNTAEQKFTFKYNKAIKLKEHIDMTTYSDGNTDLYFVIPYKRDDGHYVTTVYNPELNRTQDQMAYIALKITDMNGDGDIKFDHTDKIDYINSVEVTFHTPNVI